MSTNDPFLPIHSIKTLQKKANFPINKKKRTNFTCNQITKPSHITHNSVCSKFLLLTQSPYHFYLESKCVFWLRLKMKIISLFSLFLLLFMGLTALFALFMGSTVPFQLISIFIYSTFSNNFSISPNKRYPNIL